MAASDAELMDQIKEGDRRAFAQLVNRYKDPLVAYLTRLTGDKAWAEDLVQETFIGLFHKSQAYREQGKLGAYLYRLASNQARSALRRRKRRSLLRRMFLARDNGQRTADPEHLLEQSRVSRKVSAAIVDLPLKWRVPLVLHELQGMPYGEVAQACKVPLGTVKSRVSRARKMLRQSLSDSMDGGAE